MECRDSDEENIIQSSSADSQEQPQLADSSLRGEATLGVRRPDMKGKKSRHS